jgi:hypothetical protein
MSPLWSKANLWLITILKPHVSTPHCVFQVLLSLVDAALQGLDIGQHAHKNPKTRLKP